MSELEEKLGAVLNDPKMMQQIMAMAQALGGGQGQKPEEAKPADPPPAPQFSLDPKILQSLAGFTQQNRVDQHQQALLQALSPYLSQNRVGKLERAMRAARMAGVASIFLNAGGLSLLTGR